MIQNYYSQKKRKGNKDTSRKIAKKLSETQLYEYKKTYFYQKEKCLPNLRQK